MEAVGEDGEAFGEVFFLGDDAFGELEFGGGEIPDAADAGADHGVGGGLGAGAGDGEDAEEDFAAAHEGGEVVHGLDFAAVDPGADDFGVAVEGADDAEAEVFEALVAEEGGAEVAGADEDGFGLVVPAEKAFDGGDEFGDAKADAGFADNAGDGEVFADDDGFEVVDAGEDGAGDEFVAFGLEDAQELEVRGHAFDAGEPGLAGAFGLAQEVFREGGFESNGHDFFRCLDRLGRPGCLRVFFHGKQRSKLRV